MQLKAAGSAGALYLFSPVAVPGLTLKTRGGAHYYNDFRRVLPKGERENPGRTGGLALRGSTGSVGKLTLQRDCGVGVEEVRFPPKQPKLGG